MTEEKEKKEKKRGSSIIQLLAVLLIIVLLRFFVVGTIYVKGSSMEPNFHHGDFLLMNKLDVSLSTPSYGDIVICQLHEDGYDENIIKRVIGVPGDEVNLVLEGNAYALYLNGEKIEEPYIAEPMYSAGTMEYPYTVPEDSFFVMGDNRNASTDSRKDTVGAIEKKDIKGKIVMRLYPFRSFGIIR